MTLVLLVFKYTLNFKKQKSFKSNFSMHITLDLQKKSHS